MNKWMVTACVLGASLLGSSAQGARVIMDTRLSPQPTYAPQEAQVLRDAFGPGQIPSCRDTRVTDRTPGAFTRRGTPQTAYLIHSCGSTRLVIYAGGRIVRTLRNVGNAIGNVGDLNLDGVDDLLFLATYTTGRSGTGCRHSSLPESSTSTNAFSARSATRKVPAAVRRNRL